MNRSISDVGLNYGDLLLIENPIMKPFIASIRKKIKKTKSGKAQF